MMMMMMMMVRSSSVEPKAVRNLSKDWVLAFAFANAVADGEVYLLETQCKDRGYIATSDFMPPCKHRSHQRAASILSRIAAVNSCVVARPPISRVRDFL